jgi:dihydroorotate dehydrogenase
MGVFYRWFGRPLLKFQDSERAHLRSLKLLRLFSNNPLTRSALKLTYKPRKSVPVEVFGHVYPHPFGLAAGMDKNAIALRGWEATGLSFIEIGGVTQHRQDGNPKPRMFRADATQALVNRMGFNNEGSEQISKNLDKHFAKYGSPNVPLWVNLGKSKITPLENAHEDYGATMRALWKYTDVFVVNVSSPNTPNLRELQNDEGLMRILEKCHQVNRELALSGVEKPILVKVAPDLTNQQLEHVVHTARSSGASGIVLSNTTLVRPDAKSPKEQMIFAEKGGLSGRPLMNRSTEMIRIVSNITNGEWPIIGVGGVMSAADAWEKILAGASLVQAYSGFVFEGPSLTKSVVHGIHKSLERRGYLTLSDAIGAESESS